MRFGRHLDRKLGVVDQREAIVKLRNRRREKLADEKVPRKVGRVVMIIEPHIKLAADGNLGKDHNLLLAIAKNPAIVVIGHILGADLIGRHDNPRAIRLFGVGLKNLNGLKRSHIAKALLAFFLNACRRVDANDSLHLIAV